MAEDRAVRRRPIPTSTAAWHARPAFNTPDGPCLVYEAPFRGLLVLSGLYTAMSGNGNPCPHWHVSVSRPGSKRKPRDEDLALVRHDFDMKEAEEDNHERYSVQVRGRKNKARHLWLAVPPEERADCGCKEDEDQALIEGASTPVEVRGVEST